MYHTSDDSSIEDEGTPSRTEQRADRMDRGMKTPVHWQLFPGDETEPDMGEGFIIYRELQGRENRAMPVT